MIINFTNRYINKLSKQKRLAIEINFRHSKDKKGNPIILCERNIIDAKSGRIIVPHPSEEITVKPKERNFKQMLHDFGHLESGTPGVREPFDEDANIAYAQALESSLQDKKQNNLLYKPPKADLKGSSKFIQIAKKHYLELFKKKQVFS